MRQCAQFMDRLQCAVPFDPMPPVQEKQNCRANKHHGADARVQRLHGVGEVLEIELPDMRHQEPQQDDDAQAQHHCDAPQQQVRLLNPARPREP